jgi:ferritin
MDIILQARDHTTYVTFQYLLKEQFEEEVELSKIIDRAKIDVKLPQ